MDGGGGVDTEQKGSFFGLGVFLHFFSSSRRFLPRHAKQHKNVCDIFPFLFSKRRTSRQVSGAKKRTRRRDDDAQNKTINRHTKSSLFITQATLTMSIAQLGSTTAVSIHFVELDLRVARWMQGSRGCE